MIQQNENGSAADAAAEKDDFWQHRELCSDGNCIGVIGPDGCCKECGKPLSESDWEISPTPPENEPEFDASDNPDDPSAVVESADDTDQHWADRKLCSDGNCIGVIGPDGKCRECGRVCET